MPKEEARLNVRIDRQLLTEARVKAIRHNTTVSQLVRDFLTRYIDTKQNGHTK